MATLSFIFNYWQWIIIGVVGVVGLGALAWFTKNWKFVLGAGVITIAALAYHWSYTAGYNARVAQDVAAQTKILKDRIELQDQILTDYESAAKRDDAELETLKAQIEATPENKSACLDEGAAKRIGGVK